MNWNYRIMHYRDGNPRFAPYTHGTHEVYHAEDGSVKTWTEGAVALLGLDRDDLEWRLRAMLDAFTRPVLEYELANSE
jgi:hypothetical protein